MRRYEDFVKAYNNLSEIFDREEPYGNIELAGMVGLFSVCFEQAWKAMKEVLQENGFPEGKTGSPKVILKTAYQAGMIKDENIWMDALVSRNNVAHAYHEGVARDIIKDTKARYYDMFGELKREIDEKWL